MTSDRGFDSAATLEGKKYWEPNRDRPAGRLRYLWREMGPYWGLVWLLGTPVRRSRLKRNGATLVASARAHNDTFFAGLGVTRHETENRMIDALVNHRSELVDQEADTASQSMHFAALAALACSGFRPATILEIGTYMGETTAFLASLFPEATIHTVELPEHDPLFTAFHDTGEVQQRLLAERLDNPRIVCHRVNSMHLGAMNLPGWDLVWLDGGHRFPELAWDHAYAVNTLNPGGWLLSDDIVDHNNPYTQPQPRLLEPLSVINYLRDRLDWQGGLLHKREDPVSLSSWPKHIAWLHRPAETP